MGKKSKAKENKEVEVGEMVLYPFIMTNAIRSAILRKDTKVLAAVILKLEGRFEQADEMEASSRMTKALVDRTCINPDAPVEAPIEVDAPSEEKTKEVEAPVEVDESALMIVEIEALCNSGDKKSIKQAKKAFESQFSEDHPDYERVAKMIKKAKKGLKNG